METKPVPTKSEMHSNPPKPMLRLSQPVWPYSPVPFGLYTGMGLPGNASMLCNPTMLWMSHLLQPPAARMQSTGALSTTQLPVIKHSTSTPPKISPTGHSSPFANFPPRISHNKGWKNESINKKSHVEEHEGHSNEQRPPNRNDGKKTMREVHQKPEKECHVRLMEISSGLACIDAVNA